MALKQVIDVGGQGEAPRSRDIAGSGSAYAKNTNFDPTGTDFESTNLQALGEEIDGSLNTKASKSNLSNYILTGTKPSTVLTRGTFFVDKDGALRVATDDIATTDDVGSCNSEVKSVGEVLSELNSNLELPSPYNGIKVLQNKLTKITHVSIEVLNIPASSYIVITSNGLPKSKINFYFTMFDSANNNWNGYVTTSGGLTFYPVNPTSGNVNIVGSACYLAQ